MTTDGAVSYIFFIYDTTPLPYPYVTGFSSGDGHRYSDIITPPAISNIFRVEGITVKLPCNNVGFLIGVARCTLS